MMLRQYLPILIFLGAGLLGFAAGELAATDPFLARFGAPPPHLELLAGAAGGVLALTLATLWKVTTRRSEAQRGSLLPAARVNQPQGPFPRAAAED